jgi:hypothetical protein
LKLTPPQPLGRPDKLKDLDLLSSYNSLAAIDVRYLWGRIAMQQMESVMKSQLKSVARKLYGVAAGGPTFRRPRGDSYDVLDVAFFRAAMQSAEFYEQNMITARAYESHLALLTHALEIAPKNGLVLEFGVATGRTITHVASQTRRQVHGFDSFSGLPESWRTGFPQGAFAQELPQVPSNVTLHKGLFSETLPEFIANATESVALLHIDCDLYSSFEQKDTLRQRNRV